MNSTNSQTASIEAQDASFIMLKNMIRLHEPVKFIWSVIWAGKAKWCYTMYLYKPFNFSLSKSPFSILNCALWTVCSSFLSFSLVNLCSKRGRVRVGKMRGGRELQSRGCNEKEIQVDRSLMNILISVLSWRKLPMLDDSSAQKTKLKSLNSRGL